VAKLRPRGWSNGDIDGGNNGIWWPAMRYESALDLYKRVLIECNEEKETVHKLGNIVLKGTRHRGSRKQQDPGEFPGDAKDK